MLELKKDNNTHVEVDAVKPRRSQNYRQISKEKSHTSKAAHQLFIQHQMIIPENIHLSIITQPDQVEIIYLVI